MIQMIVTLWMKGTLTAIIIRSVNGGGGAGNEWLSDTNNANKPMNKWSKYIFYARNVSDYLFEITP